MDPQESPRLYGGRFRLESDVPVRGGMGSIHRARDLASGQVVAVKLLHDDRPMAVERFRQEAAVLSYLRHPAIVRYIDHGVTAAGELFLAMEWLEGETLEERLGRGPLGVLASVRLAQRALDALAFAHDKGVIHRDLKPANLFLPGGSLAEMKLLDFGVARRVFEGSRLTRTGSTIGTPLYMSPEQARGARELDGRSDLFSLATLVLECLTGRPVFNAETNIAIMVKICLDPVDVPAACPEAPGELVDILEAMLAKRREDRPESAATLRDRLARIQAGLADAPVVRPGAAFARNVPRPTLTMEQRIVSAIVLAPGTSSAGEEESGQAVSAVVDELGARLDRFLGGAAVVTLRGGGTPTDQAIRAARCALKLRSQLPAAVLAVSTGRAMIGDELPVADLVDRASVLLEAQPPGTVIVDAATAVLLDRAFEIVASDEGGRLLFERSEASAARAAPACVGRERELGSLLAIVDEAIGEPVARAVLVTAPAGGGKSRVRQELLRRAQATGRRFQLLLGRGDSIRAGAPFAVLGAALRAAAEVADADPPARQRERIAALAARHLPASDARRVAAFLGEIAGIPFPDAELPALRSAREDPRVMADQLLVAWLDWIEAACEEGPVLLVLEDLHWGDVPTVELVDAALRTLPDRPLVALAFARGEVDARFPRLWADRALQRIPLPPLTPRSCQQLARQLAGGLDERQLAWVIERSDGNAFYLEELVRAVSAGLGDDELARLPDTVLGMVQARFDGLAPEVRRVLRAASVFGETFDAEGVAALVPDAAVREALEVLEQREVVFPGADRRLTFRHALLRDAAYETLTAEDRRLTHGRAGEHLEARHEHDAIVLVEHFERGGLPARAAEHCRRAAAQALEANDLASAIERVGRAVANGAGGETLGALRGIEAQARFWSGEYAEGERAARQACGLAGGPGRLQAMSELVAALGQQARFAEIEAALAEARGWIEAGAHPSAWQMVLVRAASYLPQSGRLDLTEALLREVEAGAPGEPSIRAQLHKARGLKALAQAQLAAAAAHFGAADRAFQAAGDVRGALEARANLACAAGSGGQLAKAEQHLRELVAATQRMGLLFFQPVLLQNLGCVLADLGRLEEGRGLVAQALEVARRQRDPRMQGYCVQSLALIAIRAGDFAAAEGHARQAVEETVASLRPLARAALAAALLGQGRTDEALREALSANDLLEAQGFVEDGEAMVRLSLVQCLLAAGDRAAAATAAARALRRLEERALALDDPDWQASFFTAMPDHRHTLELARALGVKCT